MSVEDIERAAQEIRARSEIPVASPVEPEVDPRPTPFAMAVVPMSVPPDSLESEKAIDARVDRLLGELLILLAERKALNANMTATVERCSQLLEQVRTARRLVRAYVTASESAADLANPDDHAYFTEVTKLRDEANAAYAELKRWIEQPA